MHAYTTELSQRELDATYKALPIAPGETVRAADVAARGWNVRSGDLDFPVMLIKRAPLESNLVLMADYCRQRGLSHAPHGKTTMAPQLFARKFSTDRSSELLDLVDAAFGLRAAERHDTAGVDHGVVIR